MGVNYSHPLNTQKNKEAIFKLPPDDPGMCFWKSEHYFRQNNSDFGKYIVVVEQGPDNSCG